MPPTGGYRTSLSWQARYGPLGPSVTDAVFSPGQPLSPPDQEPVRVWDFPVGVNTTITPRSSDAFGFAHLRAFANVELVRLAIETRKDQLEALHWRVNPREGVTSTPTLEGPRPAPDSVLAPAGRGACVRRLAAAGAGGSARHRRAGVRKAPRPSRPADRPGRGARRHHQAAGRRDRPHAASAAASLPADHQGPGLGRPHHGRPALRPAQPAAQPRARLLAGGADRRHGSDDHQPPGRPAGLFHRGATPRLASSPRRRAGDPARSASCSCGSTPSSPARRPSGPS